MGYFLTLTARFFETLIVAISAHLSISISGIFFLGFPVLFTAGAYTTVIAQKTGFTLPFALFIAFTIVTLISYIFTIAHKHLSNDSFAVITLASILALDAVIKSWDSVTNGVLGITGIQRPSIAGSLMGLVILDGIVATILIFSEHILLKTKFGRQMRAFKEKPALLKSSGINAEKISTLVLLISGVIAGISGILTAWRIQFLDPTFGGTLILMQVATIAILAYKPRISWLIGATLIVTQLPEVLRFINISSSIIGHARVLTYSILIIVAIKTLSHKHKSTIRSV